MARWLILLIALLVAGTSGAWVRGVVPGTTFDDAHKGSLVVLSPDKLTVSAPTAAGEVGNNVRSATGKAATEKCYAEFHVDSLAVGGYQLVIFAVINSSFPIGFVDLGLDVNSFAYYSDGSGIVYNSSPISDADPYTAGNTTYVKMDRGAGSAIFGIVGGNSVTINISALGSGNWYAAVSVYFNGDQWTGKFSSPFLGTPGVGFSAWSLC